MNVWTFIAIVEWSIRIGMLPVVLRRRLDPSTTLAWLSLIWLLPEAGLPLYLLMGSHRLARKRVREYRRMLSGIRTDDRMTAQVHYIVRPQVEPFALPMILQAEKIGGLPILGGNHVELLPDTMPTVQRLIADIDSARHHVHLLFYIYADDDIGRPVAEALKRAVRRGVRCRVLMDAVASRRMLACDNCLAL